MIRMGLIGVMGEDHSRAQAPQDRDDRGAPGLRIDQSAVPEIERFAAGRAEDCRRGKSFRGPLCHRPTRRRLPARQIDDAGRVSERGQAEERATGVELDVVGMGADGEDIDGVRSLTAKNGRRSTAKPIERRGSPRPAADRSLPAVGARAVDPKGRHLTVVPAKPARLASALEGMPHRIHDDAGHKQPPDHVERDEQSPVSGSNTSPTLDECRQRDEGKSEGAEQQEPVSIHRRASRDGDRPRLGRTSAWLHRGTTFFTGS
jgi:hypothetical protein